MIVLSVIPVTMNGKDMVFSVFDLEWEKNKAKQRMIERIVEPRDRVDEVVTAVRDQHPLVVTVDAVAAGPSFIEKLEEKGMPICKIYPDGQAADNDTFVNRRSELYFRLITWARSKKGIKLKRNVNYIEQMDAIKPLERKGGKWYIESREEFSERYNHEVQELNIRRTDGGVCDEMDVYAFCFVKEEEWEDSPGMFDVSLGRTKEYGKRW